MPNFVVRTSSVSYIFKNPKAQRKCFTDGRHWTLRNLRYNTRQTSNTPPNVPDTLIFCILPFKIKKKLRKLNSCTAMGSWPPLMISPSLLVRFYIPATHTGLWNTTCEFRPSALHYIYLLYILFFFNVERVHPFLKPYTLFLSLDFTSTIWGPYRCLKGSARIRTPC